MREQILARPKQRAYLARYGRQDYFAARDMPIPDIEAAVRAISSVVEQENELSRLKEDH